jgi:biotin carboxyl carrier protein
MHYHVNIGGKTYRLDLEKDPGTESRLVCRLNGREIRLDAVQLTENSLSILIGGSSFRVDREISEAANSLDAQRILVGGQPYEVALRDARSLRNRRGAVAADAGPLKVKASMPGKVVRVLTKPGERVQPGAGIVVIEAMKMQNEVRSPKDGTVKELLAREGMNVNAGDVLAVLE